MDGDDDQSEPDLPIWSVVGWASRPLTAILELNGQSVPMKVDTGAAATLMAEGTQQQLFPEAVLEPSQVRLSTHSVKALEVVRAMRVQVR